MVALPETMTSASDNSRRALDPHLQHHSEQILPSIEQPYLDFDRRHPFQQRMGEYRHPPSHGSIHLSGQKGSELSSAWDPAISDPGTWKKQGTELVGAFSSPYSGSQAAGTVLIPLEEYDERHRRQIQDLNAGQDHNSVLSDSDEYRGSHHTANDSASTVAYSSHVWSPQRTVRGPEERHQRPPHLQVQLRQVAPGLRSASPYVVRSSKSDSLTFSSSPLDQSVAYGGSCRPSLTRNSSAILDGGFRERVPINNVQAHAPTAARIHQKQPALHGTASYTHNPDAPKYDDDPFRERDIMGLAYPRRRPSPRVAELWTQDSGTKDHRSALSPRIDSLAVTHGTQRHVYLPIRSLQHSHQNSTEKSHTHNTHEEVPFLPSYESQNCHRYVSRFSFLVHVGHRRVANVTDKLLSSPREVYTADPLARHQMVTYVPYGTANESSRTQTHTEPEHIQSSRRELVIID